MTSFTRLGARLVVLAAAMTLSPALWAAEGGAALPSLARSGPYGSPFAMLAPGAVDVLAYEGRSAERAAVVPSSSGPQTGVTPASLPRAASIAPTLPAGKGPGLKQGEAEADPVPAATPGTFGRETVKLPDPNPTAARKPRQTSSMTPDYEVPIAPNAALGTFTDIGRVGLDSRAGHIPGVRARDVGGGLTLQYKFGQ